MSTVTTNDGTQIFYKVGDGKAVVSFMEAASPTMPGRPMVCGAANAMPRCQRSTRDGRPLNLDRQEMEPMPRPRALMEKLD